MFSEGTVDNGEPMLEQVFPEGLQPMGRVYARAGEQREREGTAERNHHVLTILHHPPHTLPHCYYGVGVEESRVIK